VIDFSALSPARLAELRMAAAVFLDGDMEVRRRAGSVPALLAGGVAPKARRHYPPGDVYDFTSHAQFYFHVHREGEGGHVHLFLRPKGMPSGLVPVTFAADADTPSHLVAIGFGVCGEPTEIFTTNRWVTAEAWYACDAVIRMMPHFRFTQASSHGLAGRWLEALLGLTAPLVEDLLAERDAAIADWTQAHPGTVVYDDPALEITSRRAFDLGVWLDGIGAT
jgi:hypothetical protein